MIRFACLALILLASTAPGNGTASPPVPNRGFEDGQIVPDGWSGHASGETQAVFAWDRAQARTGTYALYLRNYGPRWAIWSSEPFAVRENCRYRLSVWVRTVFEDELSPSRLYLRVRRGRWTRVEHLASHAHPDWRQYSLEFETDAGIDSLRIELSNLGGRGTEMWFDDVELVEVTP